MWANLSFFSFLSWLSFLFHKELWLTRSVKVNRTDLMAWNLNLYIFSRSSSYRRCKNCYDWTVGPRPVRDFYQPIVSQYMNQQEVSMVGDSGLQHKIQFSYFTILRLYFKTLTVGFTKKNHFTKRPRGIVGSSPLQPDWTPQAESSDI